MRFKTKLFFNREHETFKSTLNNTLVALGIDTSRDRVQNQMKWYEVQEGETIIATPVREWITKINNEIRERNDFYRKNPSFTEIEQINTTEIKKDTEVLLKPFTLTKSLFESFLGDELYTKIVPKSLEVIVKNTSILVLSYRNKFVRIPFNTKNVSRENDIIKVSYNQSFNYFGDNRGLSDLDTSYEDLKEIQRLHNQKPDKHINVGIFEDGFIHWYNNLRLKTLRTTDTRTQNEAPLNTRPSNWTKNVGEDLNTEIGGNLKHAKSRESILSMDYEVNPTWTFNKREVSIDIELEYNQEIEDFISENLQDSIIKAKDFNQFKNYTNKLTSSCLCNCNYCTCDCNYCTCDCNYCTCNCNYCTCNCNYCTCNCNYKFLDPRDQTTKVEHFSYSSYLLCSCDINKGQWWGGEYRNILYTSCSTNRAYYKQCSCNTNAGKTELTDKLFYNWVRTSECVCNANLKNSDYKTPFFANKTDNTEFTKDNVDKEIPEMNPVFSKAETKGNEIISKGKERREYRVCVCDINKTITQVTKNPSITDTSSYSCTCNGNRNIDGSVATGYSFKDSKYGSAPNYEYPPNTTDSGVFNVVDCAANRDFETRIDYKQFWEDTIYKQGMETKHSSQGGAVEPPKEPELDTTRYDNYFLYEATFSKSLEPFRVENGQIIWCPNLEYNWNFSDIPGNSLNKVEAKALIVAYVLRTGQTTLGPFSLTKEFRDARIKFFLENMATPNGTSNSTKLFPQNVLGFSYYTRQLDLNSIKFDDKFDLDWYNKNKGGISDLKYISRSSSFIANILEAPYEENYFSQSIKEDLVNYEILEKEKFKIRFSSHYKLLPNIE